MAEAEAYASQPRDAAAGIYTETLARLYLKQGFGERALAIYRRLAQEQPDNHQLHERLRTLEQELACGGGGSDPAVQCAAPDGAGRESHADDTPSRAPDCRAAWTVVALSATSAFAARALRERLEMKRGNGSYSRDAWSESQSPWHTRTTGLWPDLAGRD